MVAVASDEQRAALQDEITQRWQELTAAGGLRLDLCMSTVSAS